MDTVYSLYNQFLGNFPAKFHGMISLILAILLAIGIYKVLRRQFVYIILLIVILPASAPILKSVWEQVLELLKFLLSRKT